MNTLTYCFILACCSLPLKQLQLNSGFGYRVHPLTKQHKFHSGIDLYARRDTVYAITSGQAEVDYHPVLGLYVRISDAGLSLTYGHLSTLLIKESIIKAGTPIAITGATGRVTGEHLHLSVSYKGKALDPLQFLYYSRIKSNDHEQQQSQTTQRTSRRKTHPATQRWQLHLSEK